MLHSALNTAMLHSATLPLLSSQCCSTVVSAGMHKAHWRIKCILSKRYKMLENNVYRKFVSTFLQFYSSESTQVNNCTEKLWYIRWNSMKISDLNLLTSSYKCLCMRLHFFAIIHIFYFPYYIYGWIIGTHANLINGNAFEFKSKYFLVKKVNLTVI